MPSFSTGTVTALTAERPGLQRVEVDGHAAYVLTDLVGPVAPGDRVVVNTTAVDLGLGSGGSHVVHWNLSRDGWEGPGGGRVMKLRYTSLQVDAGAAEEDGPFDPPDDLNGLPVVACDLHSQVACVAVAFAACAPRRRLVYVMTDSAALPAALSDVVFGLRSDGRLAATVTCGQAFGGDFEAVSLPSALQVAVAVAKADAVVVGPGPGVVGTGSSYGFGGVEAAFVVDVAAKLGGRPVLAVRYSGADGRDRHRTVSHHTAAVLSLVHVAPLLAVPEGVAVDLPYGDVRPVTIDQSVTTALAELAGLATMGRGFAEDPDFFRFAAAAGVTAARLLVV